MNRLPGLDLLRAIAIIWVMFYHAMGAQLGTPAKGFSILGWMGVDLFFVLSEFYISRALRILPAYIVVISIYFLFPLSREGGGLQPLWQFLSF